MKTNYLPFVCVSIVLVLALLISTQDTGAQNLTQIKTQFNQTETDLANPEPADIWSKVVNPQLSSLRMPAASVIGNGWSLKPGLIIDDLENIDSLPAKIQKPAAQLAKHFSPLGVKSVAEYTFVGKGFPINSVTLRLFVFRDAEKCRAWWTEKYESEGWEKHYQRGENDSYAFVDSLETNKRALAFGNVWLTSHQLRDGNEHIKAAEYVVDRLATIDAAKQDTGSRNESTKASAPSSSDAEGWNVFRGNAQSTGVAKSKLPADLDVLWEFKVPQGGFEGSPLIVKDSRGKKTVYVADMDGKLFSIDLETGEKNWEVKLAIGIAASPAYRDGKIFVGDIDGFFHCLDDNGKVVWKVETGGEISSSANFYKGHVLFGSQDAKLYLLNVSDGSTIWEYETPDQIRCSATIAGNRAFVAGCDGFLHVIDLDEGKEVGSTDIHSPTQSTPAALGEMVFFGTEQAEFIAVDWHAIQNKWAFADDNGQSSVRGSAAVTPKHVVFGSRNRQVYSLHPETGEKNWAVTLKAKVESSPAIAGDRVYVGSTDGRFYVRSLANGDPIWEKQFNGGFLSSPAVAFERLVIATDRGVVYCLGKK